MQYDNNFIDAEDLAQITIFLDIFPLYYYNSTY